MKHVRVNNANIEPVFFAYPENKTLDAVVAKYTAQKPVYDFVAPDDGFGHQFWVIDDDKDIEAVTEAFKEMPSLYIAEVRQRHWWVLKRRLRIRTIGATRNTTTSWRYVSRPSSLQSSTTTGW